MIDDIVYEEIFLESEIIGNTYLLNISENTPETSSKNREPQIIPGNLAGEILREYQIWHGGILVAHTANATIVGPPSTSGVRTINDQSLPGNLAVASYRAGSSNVWVVVTQDIDELSLPSFFPTIPVAITLAFILPVVILMITWIMGRSFAPLTELATHISERDPSNLTTIKIEHAPDEVRPIIFSLNQLIANHERAISSLDRALEHEKRFTMNAAHELLTPLAAIRSEVQLQIREAKHKGEAQEALYRISERVARAVRTVEQLLTLARLDPQSARGNFETVNLTAQLQIAAASHANKIEEKCIQISMPENNVYFDGLPFPIEILCRNIVDNAVRYAPAGSALQISLKENSGTITLKVRNDTLDPLPVYLIGSSFDRFVRGPQETEQGSGLGLSIISRIAEIHRAQLRLSNVAGGVELQIDFRGVI